MKTVGVIGGSGLYEMSGFENIESVNVETPWGKPSDEIVICSSRGFRVAFLPRHGRGHTILPSEINYRANIYALKSLGVQWIISVGAVGSMKENIKPGEVVIPDQFIDHTKKRESSFFGKGVAAHISMADPVCGGLAEVLRKSATETGAAVHKGGTYICIEGPQFSSRAESFLYRNWGADVIGMTNMPEAKLAREAEICYATLALPTDYDCWHTEHEAVTVENIIATLKSNVETAKKIIRKSLELLDGSRNCPCPSALENAIITSPEMMDKETKRKLGIIIERLAQ